jgi:L-threonylcarbamoyladenylate synthase
MIQYTFQQGIVEAVGTLQRGGLTAFPTETVYGLGADVRNPLAVRRIFAVKGRPLGHPLIIHIAEGADLDRWARKVPGVALRLAQRFWPGPLTLILKRHPEVLDIVTGGQDTVGLRCPAHPAALTLLQAFGEGVVAPSANRFGRLSPTCAADVVAELGDAVDCIIDGGSCQIGIESTILDLSGETPRILRPGAVTTLALAEVLGEIPERLTATSPRFPGSLPSHYAPRSSLRLVEDECLEDMALDSLKKGGDVAVLSKRQPREGLTGVRWYLMPTMPTSFAHRLYAQLRAIDTDANQHILVERPPAVLEWEAVNDRLERAAAGSRVREVPL